MKISTRFSNYSFISLCRIWSNKIVDNNYGGFGACVFLTKCHVSTCLLEHQRRLKLNSEDFQRPYSKNSLRLFK